MPHRDGDRSTVLPAAARMACCSMNSLVYCTKGRSMRWTCLPAGTKRTAAGCRASYPS